MSAAACLVRLCDPLCLCLCLLIAAFCLRKRKRVALACAVAGGGLLVLGGNGVLVGCLARHLEREYLAPAYVPQADCIVVLSGGTRPPTPPRPLSEVDAAGNRVLYGAALFQQGKAPVVICTGGGEGDHPEALDMAEIIKLCGVPETAIVLETKAMNTHQNAVNLRPELSRRDFKKVLLVTSAMHMPRSMGVMHKDCPGVEFIPAPTDFRVTDHRGSWGEYFLSFIPRSGTLVLFSEAMHEYAGWFYYRLRGWV